MACADVPVELGNMSPHLAEAMLVVEDMPILKRINVMVGITRSKVFFVFFHNKVMHGMNMDKSNIQHHNT